MGIEITKYEYEKTGSLGLMKPIIFCNPSDEMRQSAVSLNVRLAQELLEYEPKRRTLKIRPILEKVIAELPEGSTIKDFDVLFSPEIKINPIELLIAVCKKKEFSAIWPGEYRNGKLVYAETEHKDFVIYDLDEHDVTCVI